MITTDNSISKSPSAVSSLICAFSHACGMGIHKIQVIKMGVVYGCGIKIGRGFGVELSVPETSLQKLGPTLMTSSCLSPSPAAECYIEL